jgi:hypothetical protein
MSDGNQRIVEAFVKALIHADHEMARPFVSPDIVSDWPQSRERIRGLQAMIAIDTAYPGGMPALRTRRTLGAEDRWIIDAMMTPRRISGSGDVWVAEGDFHYPDGSDWAWCMVIELRNGQVVHTSEYWAPRAAAPAWRAQWVEPMPEDESV